MIRPVGNPMRHPNRRHCIRLIFKEYGSVFGFLFGIWFTQRSLTLITWDLDADAHSNNHNVFPGGVASNINIHNIQKLQKNNNNDEKPKVSDSTTTNNNNNMMMTTVKRNPEKRKDIALEDANLSKTIVDKYHATFHPPPPIALNPTKNLSSIQQILHKNVTYDPPYEVIRKQVDEGNLTAGQFALDFAIIGFPKCGTSTMMLWLGAHPEIQAIQKEVTTLQRNHPSQIVKQIYKYLDEGPYLRGYKSPNDVENTRAINKLNEHYPQTKLIIGLRHPVLWLQSFYNYRVQNGFEDIPPFVNMTSTACMAGMYGVCAERAQFQNNLANFGKTNLSSSEELSYFSRRYQKSLSKQSGSQYKRLANPMFLYDTAQLGDKNETRRSGFQEGLQNYLGLAEPLPPPLHQSPGKTISDPVEQARRDARKVNICDDIHKERRQKLVKWGKQTATWIQNWLLKENPNTVHVANPTHFDEIMESYGKDPCTGGL